MNNIALNVSSSHHRPPKNTSLPREAAEFPRPHVLHNSAEYKIVKSYYTVNDLSQNYHNISLRAGLASHSGQSLKNQIPQKNFSEIILQMRFKVTTSLC